MNLKMLAVSWSPLKGLGASSFQSLPGTCLGRMLESLIPEGPPPTKCRIATELNFQITSISKYSCFLTWKMYLTFRFS